MPTLSNSLLEWIKGVFGRAYYWVFALVLDPFDFYNNRIRAVDAPKYDVSLSTFFYVLGGLVVWTSFLTYHDLRRKTHRNHMEPDMPLYVACRWIARDSVWAEKYKWADDEWITRVSAELWSKWQMGRFEMTGIECEGNGGRNYLPPAMKGNALFNFHELVHSPPPTMVWSVEHRAASGKPCLFNDVCVDSRVIKEVWPPKSLWAKHKKKSPVERTADHTALFKAQDANYKPRT